MLTCKCGLPAPSEVHISISQARHLWTLVKQGLILAGAPTALALLSPYNACYTRCHISPSIFSLVEAERLLGRSLLGELDVFRAAEDVRKLGAEHVILSMGSKGAVAVWSDGRLRAKPSAVQTGSPIGAGDVLGAACVWALERGESFPEAFAWGVAAATVASSLPGLQFGTLDQVGEVKKQLEVTDG